MSPATKRTISPGTASGKKKFLIRFDWLPLFLVSLLALAFFPTGSTRAVVSGGNFVYLPAMQKAAATTQVEVCGDISTNTTWSFPTEYLITCQVRVKTGVTLTIEQGTAILIDAAPVTTLIVEGNLVTNGSAVSPVTFSSPGAVETPGAWGTVSFEPGSSGDLSYATFTSFGGIIADGADLTIRNSDIGWSDDHGLKVIDTDLTVTNSMIHHNTLDGIRIRALGQNLTPVLTNNTLDFNDTAIFYQALSPYKLKFTFSGNNGSGNTLNGIWLRGGFRSGTFHKNSGLPYIFETLTIDSGVSLQVNAGVVLKTERDFTSNQSRVLVDGMLNILGTAAEPVVITSLHDSTYGGSTATQIQGAPQPGDWRELTIQATGELDADHLIVRYAGYGDVVPVSQIQVLSGSANIDNAVVEHGLLNGIFAEDTSIHLTNSFVRDNPGFGMRVFGNTQFIEPVITGNRFDDNGTYGLYLIINGGGMGEGVISNNTGTGNGMVNGVYIEGAITDQISTWDPNPDFPYVAWTVTVNPGKKLTIKPGVVVKLTSPPDACSPPSTCRGTGSFFVDGTLASVGTAVDPIVMTSYWDDSAGGDTNGNHGGTTPLPGDWRLLEVRNGGTGNFEHTDIRYGGANAAIMLRATDSGAITFENGILSNSEGSGIGGTGSVDVLFSDILNNLANGMQTNGPASVHWSNIQGNGVYGVLNIYAPSAGYRIPAENNYWGAGSGPSNDGSSCSFTLPTGTGDTVSCKVAWDPFNAAPNASQIQGFSRKGGIYAR